MSTVSEICDAIGRKDMAAALGVRATAISNAVADGRFPAKWYAVLSDMCGQHGIACPIGLFNFLEPQPPSVAADPRPEPQEDAA